MIVNDLCHDIYVYYMHCISDILNHEFTKSEARSGSLECSRETKIAGTRLLCYSHPWYIIELDSKCASLVRRIQVVLLNILIKRVDRIRTL